LILPASRAKNGSTKLGLGPFDSREPSMRKIVILAVVAAALATSACNTVAGAGKDVSAVGKAVTGAANDVKK
jgi:predicted small secreted protein